MWAVPWRCLAGVAVSNLGVRWRCAFWDVSAWDAMCVIPVCAATGEACGNPLDGRLLAPVDNPVDNL
ncbi:MAG: hypothetical protein IJ783_06015 [Kiritimatiellae bacterium]|nr:hypothetical protein [Kiritimatiellia bacterium]